MFADKVMSRDNSPIPANALAKEQVSNTAFSISPAKFNFKPALSVSTPLPQRSSHATPHESRPLARMFSQRPNVEYLTDERLLTVVFEVNEVLKLLRETFNCCL